MLNENIKAIRKSKGLSQQDLADKLNVVRQTISKWDNPDPRWVLSERRPRIAPAGPQNRFPPGTGSAELPGGNLFCASGFNRFRYV